MTMATTAKARPLKVRPNSDELLKRANDYFRTYPKVIDTESQSPSILETLKEEIRFFERPSK